MPGESNPSEVHQMGFSAAKLGQRRAKLRQIRETVNDPDTKVTLDPNEEPEIVGQINKLILNRKGVRTAHTEHPNNPGLTLQDDDNKVRTGNKTLDTTVDADKDFKNDKALNPRAKYVPPNIVNFYSMLLTKGPAILGAMNRGMFRDVMQLYDQLDARYKEAEGGQYDPMFKV